MPVSGSEVRRPVLLSDAYKATTVRTARCPRCDTTYVDDIPLIGSLTSPCCSDWALERGPIIESDEYPYVHSLQDTLGE